MLADPGAESWEIIALVSSENVRGRLYGSLFVEEQLIS